MIDITITPALAAILGKFLEAELDAWPTEDPQYLEDLASALSQIEDGLGNNKKAA